MTPGDIAEGHGWAERDAAADIIATSHAGHVVANRVQATNGLAGAVENAGQFIGLQTGEGADIARNDAERVKRPRRNRCHAGIGLHFRIAVEPVVGSATLTES